MNKDQGAGIVERLVYSAVLYLAMKAVAKGYIETDMAIYIAVAAMGLPSYVLAWWRNRPVGVLNRAGDAIPNNSTIVITPTANATPTEKAEVKALAAAASDKVVAQTS